MSIIIGDCREQMQNLVAAGEKVQMCVTSPPYWRLRDYGVDGQLGLEESIDDYIGNMTDVFRLVRELLADDGTLWLNIGDSYAANHGSGSVSPGDKQSSNSGSLVDSIRKPKNGLKQKDLCGMPWRVAFALQADGWYLRQDIIWHKPNPMPESVRDRCTKAHEYLFLLSKSPRYYYDQDAIKEKSSDNTHARRAQYKTPDGWDTSKGEGGHGSFHRSGREKGRKLADAGSGVKNNSSMDEALAIMPDKRNKRSVWTVATQPFSGAHFATFPPALIEPCILAGSRPGDIVLDPFFGSGTTGMVAQNLGREYLGIELNPEYAKLHDERIGGQLGMGI